jgi:hypothetical protein
MVCRELEWAYLLVYIKTTQELGWRERETSKEACSPATVPTVYLPSRARHRCIPRSGLSLHLNQIMRAHYGCECKTPWVWNLSPSYRWVGGSNSCLWKELLLHRRAFVTQGKSELGEKENDFCPRRTSITGRPLINHSLYWLNHSRYFSWRVEIEDYFRTEKVIMLINKHIPVTVD